MRALLLFVLLFPCLLPAQEESFQRTLMLMGCRFDLTVVVDKDAGADAGAKYLDEAVEEIRRIERLISSWDPASQTSSINNSAGLAPVAVDPELFALIGRTVGLSRLTDGAFDITYASMDRLWRFDGSMTTMPLPAAIDSSVAKVGFGKIILNPEELTVYLTEPGMKIGFGAIGKGYAADMARRKLETMGVRAGIINASGDLTAWGKQPDGSDWLVAITNPLNKAKAFAWLPVNGRAVVTSGSYEKFVRFNGIRYAHIIDPRTGYPSTGIISATVFAPKAELADALATSVFVMGVETGLDFINQLPGVDVVIVDENNKVHASRDVDLKTAVPHD